MSEKKEKIKMYPVSYQTAHGKGVIVYLPSNPRKGKCQCCGKIIGEEIKTTQLHHNWYAYQPETVKKNPILALDNTIEVCYGCHQIADAIRALLYASPSRVSRVANQLKGEPRERFKRVLREVIIAMDKSEKLINPLAISIIEMVKHIDE
jgi:hypothetical protein